MTVSSEVNKQTAEGDEVDTSFSFDPIKLFKPETGSDHDLEVIIVNAAGVETPLSEGTGPSNYSVVVETYPGTGFVRYPASGPVRLGFDEKITMKRKLPLIQDLDIENQGGYFADLQERQFDKLVMMIQQQQEELARAVKVGASEAGGFGNLPLASSRAARFLAFDEDGNPIAADALTGTPASSFMATLLDDTTAAAARATLEVDPVTIGAETSTAVSVITNSSHTAGINAIGTFFLFEVGGSDRTLTLPSAVAAGNGAKFTVRLSSQAVFGTGDVIIQPAAGETIDGFDSYTLRFQSDQIAFVSDGFGWQVVFKNLKPILRKFEASSTMTPTPGRRTYHVRAIGGGGAGGGTQATTAGQIAIGVGGASGGYVECIYDISDFDGNGQTVVIGAGGLGVSGAAGGNGSGTTFGSLITAGGGSGGAVGLNTANDTRRAGAIGGSNTVVDGLLILDVPGNDSDNTSGNNGISFVLGHGAPGVFGGSNRATLDSSAEDAAPNTGAGGAGANREGGNSATRGGNGSSGVLWIIET